MKLLNLETKASANIGDAQIIFYSVMFLQFMADMCISTSFAVPHGVKRELWQKVYGNFVTDLTSSPKFINNSASITDILDKFDAEYDVGDDFGQRLTTYFMVPESGLYTFYMTCHYQCELWISSDSTAEHKRRILQVTDTNNDLLQNAWDKYPSQISSAIPLQRYNFYFMEAIMKENTGKDHMGIGAKFPNGALVFPIDRQYVYYKLPVEISSSLFRLTGENARLTRMVLSVHHSTTDLKCAHYCQRNDKCQSYNHVTGSGWCELNYETAGGSSGQLLEENGVQYFERIPL